MQHPNDMALGTVAAIATRIGVQPSSIIRFANSFGYDGFSDMQKVFRSRLVAGANLPYRERISAMRDINGRERGAGDPVGVLAHAVADDVESLEDLLGAISATTMAAAVGALARARTIFIVGQGRSFPVAFYLQYALSRFDLRTVLVDSIGGEAEHQARSAAQEDVLLAISFKEYAAETVRIVQAASERSVPIVAVTDGPFSPLASVSAVCFEIADRKPRAFRSLVAPLCLAQSLVVTLGHHITSRQS